MDWIGNNLYWTNDGQRKTIAVARLEKAAQSRKTLLEGDMSHPRGIVVDPVHGYEADSLVCVNGRAQSIKGMGFCLGRR